MAIYCYRDDVKIVEQFLKYDPKLITQLGSKNEGHESFKGFNFYHLIAYEGFEEMLKVLLAYDKERDFLHEVVECKDSEWNGRNPLQIAFKQSKGIAKILQGERPFLNHTKHTL